MAGSMAVAVDSPVVDMMVVVAAGSLVRPGFVVVGTSDYS
jgi:hypothetical protein